MSEFWKRILEIKPDLRIVYFSPTKLTNLECLVNSDGTVSPSAAPQLRFDSALALANAWRNGAVVSEDGRKLSWRAAKANVSFENDFFLEVGRKRRVRTLLSPANLDLDTSANAEITDQEGVADHDVDMDSSANIETADQEGVAGQDVDMDDQEPNIGSADQAGVADQDVNMEDQERIENLTPPLELQNSTDHSQLPHPEDIQDASVMQQRQEPNECSSAESMVRIPRKPCPGFRRSSVNDVIVERKWAGARLLFSPIVWDAQSCWSKNCEKEVIQCRSMCNECEKSKEVVRVTRWTSRRKPVDPERRLLVAHNSKLSGEELRQKMALIKRRKAKIVKELLKKSRKINALNKEVDIYRPEDKKHRQAIRSVCQKLGELNQKIRRPICNWKVNGTPCSHQTISINLLWHHIMETHLVPQIDANSTVEPLKRRYECQWDKCRRREKFKTFDQLRKHVVLHSGDSKTETSAAMLVEQMTNSIRAPSGRRYSNATKRLMLGGYTSRRTWRRTKAVNPNLPLPSVRSMIGWKNTGEVKSGVDYEIVEQMAKIAAEHPELRHGVLTFDEVKVSAQYSVVPKSKIVFGHADNIPGNQATTALVFQYISLFSKQRFAINVAYYGCDKLNAEVLEGWLFDVLAGLETYNFRVHALICDGAPINRSLQESLARRAQQAGYNTSKRHVIDHPMTWNEEHKLFILSDPSHALKKLRNNWANHNMEYIFGVAEDGERCIGDIKWDHLRAVAVWQDQQQRVDRRLLPKHLDLTHYEKMSVQTAVDIMSEGIEAAMVEIDYDGTHGTREYMCIGRELWLCMNDRRIYYNEEEAARIFDGLEYVGKTLRDWKGLTINPKKFLTSETYDDVLLLCDGVPEFMRYVWSVLSKEVPGAGIKLHHLSQDPLERTFGDLRQRRGGTQDMSMQDLAYNLRTINVNRLNSFVFVP